MLWNIRVEVVFCSSSAFSLKKFVQFIQRRRFLAITIEISAISFPHFNTHPVTPRFPSFIKVDHIKSNTRICRQYISSIGLHPRKVYVSQDFLSGLFLFGQNSFLLCIIVHHHIFVQLQFQFSIIFCIQDHF